MRFGDVYQKVLHPEFIPDGTYPGEHTGYIIRFDIHVNSVITNSYRLEVDEGIRGITPVDVTVTDGKFSLKYLHK